jgi:TP901 family phage tail tape measure protein
MAKKITGQDLFDVSSFDQATQQIIGLIGKINQAISGAKGEVDKLSTKLGTDLKNQINNVNSSSDKLEKELADVKTKFDQLKTTVSTSSDVIKKYEQENKRLEDQLKKVKEESTKYATSQQGVNKAQKEGGVTGAGLAQSLIGVASGAALVYKGISTLKEQLTLAVKSTIDFEKAMKEVQAISRASGQELELLTANANRLGATTEKTATDIASLQKELAKLGFNTTEILASTDAIVDLSTATGENLAGSARVAAATLRAFGLEAVEMGRVVDVMAGSFVRSGLDLEKFRESMKLVAPIARATNIDIETTTAALSKLADAGLSGSLAGTALRNLFSNMADPTSDLAQRLGFTVNSSEDLITAFKKLKDEGVGLAEAVQLVDVRARPAFFTLLNQVDAVEGLTLEYRALNGEASDLAGLMRDNLANDIEIANSAFDAMRRNIVEQFIPNMRQGAQTIVVLSEAVRFLTRDLFENMNQFSEFNFKVQKTYGILQPVVDLFKNWAEIVDDYVKENQLNEAIASTASTLDVLEGSLEGMDSLVDTFRAVKDMNVNNTYTELRGTLVSLGSAYEDILINLDKGIISEEALANQLEVRLQNQLKSYKDSIVQQKNSLQITEEEISKLKRKNELLAKSSPNDLKLTAQDEEISNKIAKNSDEIFVLMQKKSQLQEFVNKHGAKAVELEDLLKVATTGTIQAKEKVVEKTTDLLSLQIKLAQEILKSSVANNKDILKNDTDFDLDKRKIAEDYKAYRIELLNLELTAEENSIELSVDGAEQKAIRKLIAEEKYYRGLADLEREYNNNFKKAEDNLAKEAAKRGQKGIKDAKDLLKQKEKDGKEFIESIKDQSGELVSQIAGMVAQSMQQVSQITTSIFDNQQIARENELRSIDSWEQRRIELAGDNAEAIKAIEAEAERKRNEVRLRQAKADRTEALFQIAINTAQGIARAVAQSPLTGGLPFSAIVAALGAAQAAVVASRPLPQFYKGTDDSPEGLAVVGDRYGRELIQDGKTGEYRLTPNKATVQYLSEGSKVFTNKETERILSSVDHNGIAVGKLSGATQEKIKPAIDYTKLGKTFEDAVTKIPVSTTNFDQNGVRTFVTKGRNRTERLNNRYKY